jgi:CDP-6-deoxy-D-xylo-4-hexulose-3-dehydrase
MNKFIPGVTPVKTGGKVYDNHEIDNLIDCAREFWLTSGRYEKEFCSKLSKFLHTKFVLTTNSGTSANLLTMSTIAKTKAEVITVATGFPTTIAPIVQCNMTPVFVDIDLGTYNVNIGALKKAITKKTAAIFLAHTMGFPFNIDEVLEICHEKDLCLIEDNCDALGAKFKGKYTGTFGVMGTLSFYPAHHITTGEGGAVVTDSLWVKNQIQSYRDWGRDCQCDTGQDNKCGKRFKQQFGKLPLGYDHKYVFSHLGYNMKMTDMQAAIGAAQVDKLQYIIDSRQANFLMLYEIFKEYEKYFILQNVIENSEPSPFGFVLTVKDDASFKRNDIVNFLEKNLIQTRMLFAGNMVKQPCMENVKYKVSGKLTNTDKIMNNTFWIGLHPNVTDDMINYIGFKMKNFMEFYV